MAMHTSLLLVQAILKDLAIELLLTVASSRNFCCENQSLVFLTMHIICQLTFITLPTCHCYKCTSIGMVKCMPNQDSTTFLLMADVHDSLATLCPFTASIIKETKKLQSWSFYASCLGANTQTYQMINLQKSGNKRYILVMQSQNARSYLVYKQISIYNL